MKSRFNTQANRSMLYTDLIRPGLRKHKLVLKGDPRSIALKIAAADYDQLVDLGFLCLGDGDNSAAYKNEIVRRLEKIGLEVMK